MRRLHNRKQNEAPEYGSAFARAMEVVTGDARDHLRLRHGLDRRPRGDGARGGLRGADPLHPRGGGGAARRRGGGLADVVQATAFLKNPCDGRSFERIVERSALRDVPLVTTVADVCRPDLLFEIDATAVVPLRRSGRR